LLRIVHDSTRAAETEKIVRGILGLGSLDESLPPEMSSLEKIKIHAQAGFAYRTRGTKEDFERLWQEAFPIKKKGSKQ
jgi:hypothetical protein